MTDAELALQPGEIADQSVNAAGASRVQPHDLVMVFFMALSLIVLQIVVTKGFCVLVYNRVGVTALAGNV